MLLEAVVSIDDGCTASRATSTDRNEGKLAFQHQSRQALAVQSVAKAVVVHVCSYISLS